MSEEFKIVRAERTQARLRLALQGSSGGGKTATSLLIAKGMVQALGARDALPKHLDGAYIGLLDTERDSAKLYSHLTPFDTLVLAPPYTVDRYLKALGALERVGYPVIIIDQISHEWSGEGGILEQVAKASGQNDFAKWNGPSQDHDRFVDALLRSPAHIICTMRAKTAWVLEEKEVNGRMKKVVTRIGMAAKQREGTEYEFTTVLDMAVGTNSATCIKDRTELFQVGQTVPRMTPEWGVRFMDWVYSADKPEPAGVPEPTPAMRAEAIYHAAERAIGRAATLPDLAKVFDDGQKALRAQSIDAGREVVAPLLERLVAAKDERKVAFGPDARVVPDAETISPDDCANLEILLQEARVAAPDLKQHLGVVRLALIPLARWEEAQEWVIQNSQGGPDDRSLVVYKHVPTTPAESTAPTAVTILNGIVNDRIAKNDEASGSKSFFADMADDLPFEVSK
jgi:hypothetical protein